MLNDLHIHTTYSDGAFTPDEIIAMAKKKNIDYISITDHDTTGAYGNFNESDSDITIISGVEVSTYYQGLELHILSYFHDPQDKHLVSLLNRFKNDREERYYKILSNLEDQGIVLPDEVPPKDSFGRGHIAKLLVSHGHVSSIKEAFNRYLDVGKSAYEKRYKIDTRDALHALRNAGGIPILAHPGEKLANLHLEKLLLDLKVHGLLGIEVYHPSHNKALTNYYYGIASKKKLVITGGSDFHGDINMTPGGYQDKIGRYGLNDYLMQRLLKTHEKMYRKSK